MADNKKMAKAKSNKNDEFYTRIEDIENELKHYKEQFYNKIVLCNCDDPFESNFFKYFALNFNTLHLKKLITTCYNGSKIIGTQLSLFDIKNINYIEKERKAYKVEITNVPDLNKDGSIDLNDIKQLLKLNNNNIKLLKGDGDFRSEECLKFLDEADIVVTNPPFSLFKEYVPLLVNHNKKFLIIGNMQTIKYKEIFPLILDNKLWAGYSFNKTFEFIMPNSYELKGKAYVDKDGNKHGFVPGICWLTNLDVPKRHEKMILYKRYDPEYYKKYDNYDAIEVKNVNEIPCDYSGKMGVPISFLEKYNPEQFELIGSSDIPETLEGVRILGKEWINKYKEQGGTGHYTANMKSIGFSGEGKYKVIFSRLIIKNKELEENSNEN